MMQIAQSIGMDRFYNFYKAFGLTEPNGIDLPGEGKGQFHKPDVASDWNEVALATNPHIVRSALHGNADSDAEHGALASDCG